MKWISIGIFGILAMILMDTGQVEKTRSPEDVCIVATIQTSAIDECTQSGVTAVGISPAQHESRGAAITAATIVVNNREIPAIVAPTRPQAPQLRFFCPIGSTALLC